MDYPHPKFSLKNGEIDFSNAYATGIGEWDKVTVAYSYSQIPGMADEREALNTILNDARKAGLRYISDQDARPMGGAHYLAHLWDNGTSASEELEEVLKIRKVGIDNFSIDNIRSNEPNSVLEDVFAPLYFFHRYQTEAVAKVIGGLNYNYAVKGDGQTALDMVDRRIQENALKTIVKTLDAGHIAIPRQKLPLFPPRAIGYPKTRESFKGKTGVSFDALSAAETASDMSLGLLLHPERASRLVQQKSLDPKQLGLEEVFETLVKNTLDITKDDTYLNAVQQNINFRVLHHIMNLAVHDAVHPQVNALANAQLKKIAFRNLTLPSADSDPYKEEMGRRIDKFFKFPEKFKPIAVPKIPDGSPIGVSCTEYPINDQ
jgi:hypothetical protein